MSGVVVFARFIKGTCVAKGYATLSEMQGVAQSLVCAIIGSIVPLLARFGLSSERRRNFEASRLKIFTNLLSWPPKRKHGGNSRDERKVCTMSSIGSRKWITTSLVPRLKRRACRDEFRGLNRQAE